MNETRRVNVLVGLLCIVGTVFFSCGKPQEEPVTFSGTIERLESAEGSSRLILKDATWTLELGKAEYAFGNQPMKLDLPKNKLPDFTSLTLGGTVINQSSQTVPAVILRLEAIGADLPQPWNVEYRIYFERSQGQAVSEELCQIGPGESKSFLFHTAYKESKHVHVSEVRGVLIESQ